MTSLPRNATLAGPSLPTAAAQDTDGTGGDRGEAAPPVPTGWHNSGSRCPECATGWVMYRHAGWGAYEARCFDGCGAEA